jgi:hypothetical protein
VASQSVASWWPGELSWLQQKQENGRSVGGIGGIGGRDRRDWGFGVLLDVGLI